jgi:hypothetical protein
MQCGSGEYPFYACKSSSGALMASQAHSAVSRRKANVTAKKESDKEAAVTFKKPEKWPVIRRLERKGEDGYNSKEESGRTQLFLVRKRREQTACH